MGFCVQTLRRYVCILNVKYYAQIQRVNLLTLINTVFFKYLTKTDSFIRNECKKSWKNDCEFTVRCCTASLYTIIPALQVIHFFEFSNNKMYTFRLFKSLNMSATIETVVFASHAFGLCFLVLGYTSVILFSIFIQLIPAALLFQVLKECKPIYGPWNHRFKTKNDLRQIDTMILVYKTLKILTVRANEMLSRYLLLIQQLVSYAVVACNVSLLQLRDSLSWKINALLMCLSLVSMMFWIIALYSAGFLFKATKRWIDLWKRSNWLSRNKKSKYYKKVIKSFKPAAVVCSGCFILTLIRVLKFMNFVTWGTMKGLLYMKQHR